MARSLHRRYSFRSQHTSWTGCLLLIFCLFFLPSTGTGTSEIESIFQQGNAFYQQGKYEEAIAVYQQILDQDFSSGILYYNLGNAYYRLGDNARAILNYERAKKYMPNDPDLDVNLHLAQLNVQDKITPVPDVIFTVIWKWILHRFSLHEWIRVFLSIYILFGLSISAWILIARERGRLRNALRYGAMVLGLMTGGSAVCLGSIYQNIYATNTAIVLDEKAIVRSEPNQNSDEVFTIHTGTKFHIRRQVNGWLEIRIANGNIGWIPNTGFERI